MALVWKCLEPAAQLGCALAGALAGGFTGGALAGVAVAGIALFSRVKEHHARTGMDNEKLVADLQKSMLRSLDRWDQSQEDRDALVHADAAMARYLPTVGLTRQELAESSISTEAFPMRAATMIADRLAAHDPVFAKDGIERRFAIDVVAAALDKARDDPAYAPLLTLDMVIAGNRAHAETHSRLQDIGGRFDSVEDKLNAMMAMMQGQSALPDEALHAVLRRLIGIHPDAGRDTILEELQRFELDYSALKAQAAAILVNDNRIQSLKCAAEDAIAAAEFDRARTLLGEAAEAARKKATEPVRTVADLFAAQASAHLLAFDWRSASATWQSAHDVLLPFDAAKAASYREHATHRIRLFGEAAGDPGALDEGIRLAETLKQAAIDRGDDRAVAGYANDLGNVLSSKAAGLGADGGRPYLVRAIANYREAIAQFGRDGTNGNWSWANSNNGLGNALKLSGEWSAHDRIIILKEAAATFRSALEVFGQETYPNDWATVQSNLGTVLEAIGRATPGRPGNDILRQALDSYQLALVVRKRDKFPDLWAASQHNLSSALIALAERSEPQDAVAILDRSETAVRSALEIRTEAVAPARWGDSINSLGIILRLRAGHAGQEEAVALLHRAIDTFEQALRVRTRDRTPASWTQTRKNMFRARLILAGKLPVDERIVLLRIMLADEAIRDDMALLAETEGNLAAALLTRASEVVDDDMVALLRESIEASQREVEARQDQSPWLAHYVAYTRIAAALRRLCELVPEEQRDLAEPMVAAYEEAMALWHFSGSAGDRVNHHRWIAVFAALIANDEFANDGTPRPWVEKAVDASRVALSVEEEGQAPGVRPSIQCELFEALYLLYFCADEDLDHELIIEEALEMRDGALSLITEDGDYAIWASIHMKTACLAAMEAARLGTEASFMSLSEARATLEKIRDAPADRRTPPALFSALPAMLGAVNEAVAGLKA
ncbi:MAG TPA: hypothetical protein PKD99_15785 [Sphingopyxis sp.]|nr:hypothetical protein [Sphingopyxis sp.]HMP46560.1 hypothetical protein [Sphingopyxis sp.]